MMLASPRHRQRITASSRQLTGSKLRVAEVKRDPSPDTHTGPPSLHASWIDQAHQRGHGPPDGAKSGCCLADIVQQSSSQHWPTNTRAEVSCHPSGNTNPVTLVGVCTTMSGQPDSRPCPTLRGGKPPSWCVTPDRRL